MMRSMSLAELQAPLQATLTGADVLFSGVTTDSRAVKPGDLFVALRGENFDGHDFLEEVAAKGAVAALVSRTTDSSLPSLQVADTQRALGKLGAFNRSLYEGTVVAITGSSGKTTVKNMVHAVLAQRGTTLATIGNLNNEIGVPLTLLRLEPGVEFAVVEMGAGKGGDIQWLCELGRPTVSVLVNAGTAHLEGFGSVEGIAAGKGEIFEDLGSDGFAIVNADQPWAAAWRERAAPATVLDFGLLAPAALTARNIEPLGVNGIGFTAVTPAGETAIRLALPGVHNVANALAAAAVGLACGLELAEICVGLESARATSGRLEVAVAADGATFIDDCYNANPGSVKAAIDMLAACTGRRTIILGAMLELGDRSEELHREIGAYAREAGLDGFCGVGAQLRTAVEAFGEGARWFADRDAAAAALRDEFAANDTVLLKGSRGARMELLLSALEAGRPMGEG